MKVPFNDFTATHQAIGSETEAAIARVLKSGWFVLGKEVEEFERQYAIFNHVNYCVGVANGLDALYISLKALNIKPGDEVIVPSNTYIATVLAISYVGATPVFVEPYENTYNINPNLIEQSITKRTKAIMPVHLYGQACEMDALCLIAEKHNIAIVEDNAQSQGSTCNGRLAGSFGHINATSFYPTKNLGALGDAGAVTTNNIKLADFARTFRNYGSKKKYYNEIVGANSRLDELQAAILSAKIKHLQNWNTRRAEIAGYYSKHLAGVGDIVLPRLADNCTSVWHLYVIQTNKRDQLISYLQQYDIATSIHYPVPPHLQQAYSHLGFKKGDFPIAERLAEKVLSLPIYPEMTDEQCMYVCDKVINFFKQ